MNEFTGAVLKGQLQKLETICSRLRANTRSVCQGIADLPGLKLRKWPDPDGDVGVAVYLDLGERRQRDQFLRALRAEGIAASGPSGSAILPIARRIENKATLHPEWPSFQTPAGKAIRYGATCCPRTIDIIDRFGGVLMDPNFTEPELQDIIQGIRKVYLALQSA
jgi:dTDP-4-amino-4,6-dideoxygalactose transaminase